MGPPVMRSVRAALSISILVAASLVLQFRSTGEAVPVRRPLTGLPTTLGSWQSRGGVILETDILSVLKASDYVMRAYQDPGGRNLWLFIGYWDSQRRGAQPHSPKNCLPGSGWEPLEASRVTIPLPQPFAPITVNRFLIQKDRDQQVVFYWYQSQGEAIPGEIAARIQLVRNSIWRHRTDGALVRVSGPVYGTIQETSDRLVEYIQAMYPVLGDFLPA